MFSEAKEFFLIVICIFFFLVPQEFFFLARHFFCLAVRKKFLLQETKNSRGKKNCLFTAFFSFLAVSEIISPGVVHAKANVEFIFSFFVI